MLEANLDKVRIDPQGFSRAGSTGIGQVEEQDIKDRY
jgi:hypothetical protein